MTPASRRRTGFTLVELLVVITILGVLVALLVPAITGAVRRARQSQAEAQINTLAGALASFKAKYGEFPPSRLVFHESGRLATPPAAGPTAGSGLYFQADYPSQDNVPESQRLNLGGATLGPVGPAAGSQEHSELVTRSLLALRSIFPKLSVSNSVAGAGDSAIHDINGNGVGEAEPILLDGQECLYLFLCGIPDWSPGTPASLRGAGGFSVSPRNPFQAVPASGPDSSRTTPFFEITDPSQLYDDDRDFIPGIVDPIGASSDARYVAYFSSTFGGYDPRDVKFEDEPTAPFTLTGYPDSYTTDPTAAIQVPGPNPWTNGPSFGTEAPRWLRPQSFQLVSPGSDRDYGPGGQVVVQDGSMTFPEVSGSGGRAVEDDNVGMR
ncbi:type II secretion system protein [Tautonia plasticadhaerens]|uniref:Type II secretion system protein G n=1 Tax=Tautonia plasticadhaerens TaxID=2527974 RepID=A0A518H4Z3_9BACT|nr:type II secretion system protein [Tautonia plasticadhaerens]QDV35903.1 Type II secretion system protein G precursor [Tautonia plasticadhaerens]